MSAVTGFTVQFAAFPTEDRATEAARAITADGQHPRVVQGHVGGAVVFRVVLGPYATRGDAERVGHDAGHGYWVYPGTP